jgi:hypothetical protein
MTSRVFLARREGCSPALLIGAFLPARTFTTLNAQSAVGNCVSPRRCLLFI